MMDGGGLTTRTVYRWRDRLDARVLPLISDDADDVGYDFTTSLDPHSVMEMEISGLDKVSVVECDTRDSHSRQLDRRDIAYRCQDATTSDLSFDFLELCPRKLCRELIGDGSTRMMIRRSEYLSGLWIDDFDDESVEIYIRVEECILGLGIETEIDDLIDAIAMLLLVVRSECEESRRECGECTAFRIC